MTTDKDVIVIDEFNKFRNSDFKGKIERAFKTGYWNVYQYTTELEDWLKAKKITYKALSYSEFSKDSPGSFWSQASVIAEELAALGHKDLAEAMFKSRPSEEYDDSEDEGSEVIYFKLSDQDVEDDRVPVAFIGKIEKSKSGKWVERKLAGKEPYGFGGKSYMSYLTAQDVMQWLRKDYERHYDVEEITEEEVADYKEAIERQKSEATAKFNNKQEFVSYLLQTLIPDLRESGRDATADDYTTLVYVLRQGELPKSVAWDTVDEFVGYLEETLIPDLKESGSDATAEDFETGIKFIKDSK